VTATTLRPLTRDGIPAIWTIDRSEINHRLYRLIDGRLVLHQGYFALQGWPPGHLASDALHLPAFLERGGHLVGAFHGDRLVGLLGVGKVRLGVARDGIQLTRLYAAGMFAAMASGSASSMKPGASPAPAAPASSTCPPRRAKTPWTSISAADADWPIPRIRTCWPLNPRTSISSALSEVLAGRAGLRR
jgi:hypothetical protein